MFSSSSQLKFWTFSGTTEINRLRAEANHNFYESSDPDMREFLLSAAEERIICRHYEYVIKDFCGKFQPPMPKYVVGTSIAFFKRFYLHNSVMDYHPNEIIYTCIYLACKVEEFNVSISQFVDNMTGNKERATDVILAQELLLMQQLHYHLTVHNPFRPLEGLLIDIKSRCSSLDDAEKLRKGADEFLDRALNTDVILIFAPSQIALAAILSSASKIGTNLDSYVTNSLLGTGTKENIMKTVEHIKRIRFMVKHQELLDRDEVHVLERKLESCRNQDNNPESETYWQKMEEMTEEEEERRARKRRKLEMERDDSDLLL